MHVRARLERASERQSDSLSTNLLLRECAAAQKGRSEGGRSTGGQLFHELPAVHAFSSIRFSEGQFQLPFLRFSESVFAFHFRNDARHSGSFFKRPIGDIQMSIDHSR